MQSMLLAFAVDWCPADTKGLPHFAVPGLEESGERLQTGKKRQGEPELET